MSGAPAKLLIEQHGDEAPIEAAMRANEMLDAGDLDGQPVWKVILKVLSRIERSCRELHRTQAQAAAFCHRPIAWLRNWRNVFRGNQMALDVEVL